MSSAIATIGGEQLIQLQSRLVLGFYLQGTLGHLSPQSPHYIKPRPYLRYLGDTLRNLRCDTTVFVTSSMENNQKMLRAFARDFPAPFRVMHDNVREVGMGGGGNHKGEVAHNNFTQFLNKLAAEANSPTTRVLFVDTEVNYRYPPLQTLVLEAYEPLTKRQQRQLARAEAGSRSITPEQAARYGITSRSSASVQRHQLHIAGELEKTNAYTELLTQETKASVARGGGGRVGSWLGSRMAQPRPASDVVARRQQGAAAAAEAAVSESVRQAVSPFAQEGMTYKWEPRTESGTPLTSSSSSAASSSSAYWKSDTQKERMLAINMEDYTLVALAEMITELAASDVAVGDYLRMEPLIEEVNVPFHGRVNYLAMESCDDIALLEWEKIRVVEEEAEMKVADVEETEAHKDFFQ